MHHKLKISVLTLFLGLTSIYHALTSSGGAPLGFSSAPGESNCTSCHGGIALNSGPATRSLTFNGSSGSSYVPGQTYTLSFTITRATRNKYGFQLKVEDAQGGDAGTLISTTNRTWVQQGYLNQSASGNSSTTSGTISWTFQWTAPSAGTGPVTFYIASNAANNNGGTSGDEIYTDAVTLQESTPSYTVSGILQYDNAAGTPVINSTVRLLGPGGSTLQTTTTNSLGQYSFGSVSSGSYSVTASSTRPWGGVSSADALLITRYFNNTVNLSGLRLISGDVNASNSVASSDALLVSRRVSGLINSFSAGDWKFETVPVTVSASNITQNIRGICVGDVNASFQPPQVRMGSLTLDQHTSEFIPMEGAWVGLKLKHRKGSPFHLGSVTLDLEAPQGWQIEGIRSTLNGMNPEYSLEGNRLKLSWFNPDGMGMGHLDPVLYLKVIPGPELGDIWSISSSTEFTDPQAEILSAMTVVLPRLQVNRANLDWNLQTMRISGDELQIEAHGQGTLHLIAMDILGRVLYRQTLNHALMGTTVVSLPRRTAVISGMPDGAQAPILIRTAF